MIYTQKKARDDGCKFTGWSVTISSRAFLSIITLLDKVSAHPKNVGTSHIVHKCRGKLTNKTAINTNHNTLNFSLSSSYSPHDAAYQVRIKYYCTDPTAN